MNIQPERSRATRFTIEKKSFYTHGSPFIQRHRSFKFISVFGSQHTNFSHRGPRRRPISPSSPFQWHSKEVVSLRRGRWEREERVLCNLWAFMEPDCSFQATVRGLVLVFRVTPGRHYKMTKVTLSQNMASYNEVTSKTNRLQTNTRLSACRKWWNTVHKVPTQT